VIVQITKDDGIRRGTTMEGLSRLKPVFKEDGTTTAGNSSQITDGAAAVLLAGRSAAKRLGLPILGVFRAYSVVGVSPDVMGIGPAYAIPAVLEKSGMLPMQHCSCHFTLISIDLTGLSIDDIDIFEINEAFASQATYCVEKLKIPMEKVNPKGGAIALGHPVGCTGARQIGTLLHELKRRGKKRFDKATIYSMQGRFAIWVFRSCGVISMCMGTGMGAAAVIEYTGN
jgi:acetyl-CoA acyltransferase 1